MGKKTKRAASMPPLPFWIVVFLVGGVLGFAVEVIGTGPKRPKDPITVLPWGAAATLVVLIRTGLPKVNIFALAFFTTLLMGVLECGYGTLGEKLIGERMNWRFSQLAVCNNYSSLPTSVIYFFLILFVFCLVDLYQHRQKSTSTQ